MRRWNVNLFVILLMAVSLVQCDSDEQELKGSLRLELTDAPVDDPNISGVFVTVTEIKVDGSVWAGLNEKVTIDVLALQNGNTRALGVADLNVQAYENIELILDLDADSAGQAPGCYVLTKDNVKHQLSMQGNSSMSLFFDQGKVDLSAEQTAEVVLDFDLRKVIKRRSNDTSDYQFAAESQIKNNLRFVTKGNTGTILGNCNDMITNSDRIVVFAYAKGSYNHDAELDTSEEQQFAHAITSASVQSDGDYRLSFLEQGEYELVFVSYKDQDSDGRLEARGSLELNTLLGLDASNISVTSSSNTQVNVVATGLLPI